MVTPEGRGGRKRTLVVRRALTPLQVRTAVGSPVATRWLRARLILAPGVGCAGPGGGWLPGNPTAPWLGVSGVMLHLQS